MSAYFLATTFAVAAETELRTTASAPRKGVLVVKPSAERSRQKITIRPAKEAAIPATFTCVSFSSKKKWAKSATKNGRVAKRTADSPDEMYCSPQKTSPYGMVN